MYPWGSWGHLAPQEAVSNNWVYGSSPYAGCRRDLRSLETRILMAAAKTTGPGNAVVILALACRTSAALVTPDTRRPDDRPNSMLSAPQLLSQRSNMFQPSRGGSARPIFFHTFFLLALSQPTSQSHQPFLHQTQQLHRRREQLTNVDRTMEWRVTDSNAVKRRLMRAWNVPSSTRNL